MVKNLVVPNPTFWQKIVNRKVFFFPNDFFIIRLYSIKIKMNYTGQQIHVCSYSNISSPCLATIPCNFSFRFILESSVKMLDFNSCLVTVSSSLLSNITSKSLSTIGSKVSSRRSKSTYKK